MESDSVCDPCGDGEGLACLLRIVSNAQFEEQNRQIRDAWTTACSHWRGWDEIGRWKQQLEDAAGQLQAALKELDDAVESAQVGVEKAAQGRTRSIKRSIPA